MSLPTLQKTWHYDVSHSHGTYSNADDDGRNNALMFKNALVSHLNSGFNYSANPWNVMASCDGTSAASGIDLWTNYLTVQPNAWIRIRQPAIGPTFEILITIKTDVKKAAVMFSLVGFSGGDNTNRPTAADEQLASLIGSPSVPDNLVYDEAAVYVHHAWTSDDGEATYYMVTQGATGSNVLMFFMAQKPRNPAPNWTTPNLVAHFSTATGQAGISDFYHTELLMVNNNFTGYINGDGVNNVAWTTEWIGYDSGHAVVSLGPDQNSIYPIVPVGAVTFTPQFEENPPHVQRLGELWDIWHTSPSNWSINPGDTFPSDHTKQFAVFGQGLLMPWPGSAGSFITVDAHDGYAAFSSAVNNSNFLDKKKVNPGLESL